MIPICPLPWCIRARQIGRQTAQPGSRDHSKNNGTPMHNKPSAQQTPPLGQRIHVIGNSCAGKSTLAEQLADALDVPFVELDALNWRPNWVALNHTAPDELTRLIQEATAGKGWVVAGSYMNFSQNVFWPRLQTVVWLDPPLPRLLWRVLRRSWKRWRSKELLWGTNYENFWSHLMLWKKDESLIWWIVAQHKRKRRDTRAYMADPRWRHIHFVRLGSRAEVEAFMRAQGLTN